MTNWGRAYYTNALALVPLALIMPAMNEQRVLMGLEWNLQVGCSRDWKVCVFQGKAGMSECQGEGGRWRCWCCCFLDYALDERAASAQVLGMEPLQACRLGELQQGQGSSGGDRPEMETGEIGKDGFGRRYLA